MRELAVLCRAQDVACLANMNCPYPIFDLLVEQQAESDVDLYKQTCVSPLTKWTFQVCELDHAGSVHSQWQQKIKHRL